MAPLTYSVGYSASASEAVGVETDGVAIASIDLQAQNDSNTYSTSKLHGTFAVSCLNAPGFSDLNYVHFDGNGGSTGADVYNDGGNLGNGPGGPGVIYMELLSVIRRWAFRDRLSIREISRRTNLSRNTIRKSLGS